MFKLILKEIGVLTAIAASVHAAACIAIMAISFAEWQSHMHYAFDFSEWSFGARIVYIVFIIGLILSRFIVVISNVDEEHRQKHKGVELNSIGELNIPTLKPPRKP